MRYATNPFEPSTVPFPSACQDDILLPNAGSASGAAPANAGCPKQSSCSKSKQEQAGYVRNRQLPETQRAFIGYTIPHIHYNEARSLSSMPAKT